MNALRMLVLAVLVLVIWVVFSTDQKPDRSESEWPVVEPPRVEQPEGVEAVKAPRIAKNALQPVEIGRIAPLHKFGEIYLAGQPVPEALPVLKQQGFNTILTLRKSDEVSWDEQAATEEQGMQFVQVAFQGVGELTPEVFDKVLEVLRDETRQPLLFHCGSANRVGAIWYAFRVLDDKLSHEEALAEAKAAGLRTEGYVEKAREYVLAVQLLAVNETQP
ncbi:MAG: hypothetical protein MI725_09750 [Pirellulales bacterium]|nr:hypothetical protein [Pirellulales bacterium]